MSTISQVVYNTFYQLLAKSASIFSTVTATALITRGLGVPAFGRFFLMTGFASYFFLLIDFGLNTVAARSISREPDIRGRYFSNILALRLCYSLALVLILSLSMPFIPFRLEDSGTLRWGIFIGLLALVSQAIYNSCTIVFQATLNYQKAILGSIIGNLFFLISAFLILRTSGSLILLVTVNTIGSFLVSLTALYQVKDFVGRIRLNFDLVLWRSLLVDSWPLGLTIFLTVIVAKADTFLLSLLKLPAHLVMTNADALGHYGLAYKIFENILVLPTYFVNALFPILVRHDREGPDRVRATLKHSLTLMLSVSLLVVLISFWLAPLAISVLADQPSPPSVGALRILVLGLPLFFASAVLMFFLISSGRERFLPWIYLVAAFFNIGLNLFYIPRYGLPAAAIITGLTELLILTLLVLASCNCLRQSAVVHERV